MSFIINPDDKFYPQANEWMWNYCTFLGKFTDEEGDWDLGVHFYPSGQNTTKLSDASVHSNTPGSYISGTLSEEDKQWCIKENYHHRIELYRRLDILHIRYK